MDDPKLSAIVISASSGIGEALCRNWAERRWSIFGTFRTPSPHVDSISREGIARLFPCDLQSVASIDQACQHLIEYCPSWDVLVLAAGNLEPVGTFETVDFDQWENGIQLNFLRQMRIVHRLLPFRNRQNPMRKPCVLFFAGGGTNNAVSSYSSYAISKIGFIKMCEFLDAEIPDTRFTIIGPGWVKTKIHEATLKAGPSLAGAGYAKTLIRMREGDWVPMERVVECCTWAATTRSDGVSGRNFSAANDAFTDAELEKALETDPDMYKLRRWKNDWKNP